MTIVATCPHCSASFQVKDEHAGKRAKCPKCQGAFQVPAVADVGLTRTTPAEPAAPGADSLGLVPAASVPAEPPPTRPAPAKSPEAILAALQGNIERVPVPITYRLGIVLVAVVMVVLPLVYVALIGLVGWLLYLHAIYDTFMMGRGRAGFAPIAIYFAPLIAGAILILFMIKPLFARPARMSARRSLSRQNEPLLFAFVERICAAVGAPVPKRIDVDTEVNASASFRRGWWSLVVGNDLVLTIGLPLVAGLNLRQFAGVLAHEFGHFSQGVGMRLTYVIRSISFWFTRVVYERDVWDQRLAEWSASDDNRLALIFLLTRFFVWLTRRVLWCLMMIGHAVSGLMLRQMEFDADRYEARLGGSDTFEATCRRLMVLNVAAQGAHADLGAFFREGRLGDNLPRLVLHNITQIPEELLRQLNEAIDQSTTGWFDTHPADKDRIANARRQNAPGIFRLEQPASVLFADFTGLSINATLDFYRAIFGPQFKNVQVKPLDSLLARQGQEQEAIKALRRYFQNQVALLRPLHLPSTWITAPSDPKQTAARLKAARQRMLDQLKEYEQPFADYQKADDLLIETVDADALLRAGLKVTEKDFSRPMPDCIMVRRAREEAIDRQRQAEPHLTGFEQAAGERLHAALELLYVPQVAARLKEASHWQEEVKRILPALSLLLRESPSFLALREAHVALATVASKLEANQQNESLIDSIRKRMTEVYRLVLELHRAFGAVAYPFDHAKGSISLGDYTLTTLPTDDDLGGIYQASRDILATVHDLYGRLVGRVAQIAERVESLLGLEPLPEPAEKPQTEQ